MPPERYRLRPEENIKIMGCVYGAVDKKNEKHKNSGGEAPVIDRASGQTCRPTAPPLSIKKLSKN
jgi:hypothetical protein